MKPTRKRLSFYVAIAFVAYIAIGLYKADWRTALIAIGCLIIADVIAMLVRMSNDAKRQRREMIERLHWPDRFRDAKP